MKKLITISVLCSIAALSHANEPWHFKVINLTDQIVTLSPAGSDHWDFGDLSSPLSIPPVSVSGNKTTNAFDGWGNSSIAGFNISKAGQQLTHLELIPNGSDAHFGSTITKIFNCPQGRIGVSSWGKTKNNAEIGKQYTLPINLHCTQQNHNIKLTVMDQNSPFQTNAFDVSTITQFTNFAWNIFNQNQYHCWYYSYVGLYKTCKIVSSEHANAWVLDEGKFGLRWQQYPMMQALIDYTHQHNDHQHDILISNFMGNTEMANDTVGDGNDDAGWLALLYLRYDLLHHSNQYYDVYKKVYDRLTASWEKYQNYCGGGVSWKMDVTPPYINAITNELYFTLSAGMYLVNNDQKYLESALKEWQWFQQSGMINHAGLINDGLSIIKQGQCQNNGQPTWSYNQGVVLGGLSYLYQAVKAQDPQKADGYLQAGIKIVDAVLADHMMNQDGILHEPNKDLSQNDALFKGIFGYYLGIFISQLKDASDNVYHQKVAEYQDFMVNNAKVMRASLIHYIYDDIFDLNMPLYWSVSAP